MKSHEITMNLHQIPIFLCGLTPLCRGTEAIAFEGASQGFLVAVVDEDVLRQQLHSLTEGNGKNVSKSWEITLFYGNSS